MLLWSALAGALLWSLARGITFGLAHLSESFPAKWEAYTVAPYSAEVMLSLLLGLVGPLVLNLFNSDTDGAWRAARRSGDHIELIIAESIAEWEVIELSLRNRKSYVGWAIESGLGGQGQGDIVIIPAYSGYRDKETLQLIFTTQYGQIAKYRPDVPVEYQYSERFRLAIPLSEVVSARFFDVEIYDLVNNPPPPVLSQSPGRTPGARSSGEGN